MGNSSIFCGKQQIPQQMANSMVQRENPCPAVISRWPCSSHVSVKPPIIQNFSFSQVQLNALLHIPLKCINYHYILEV